MPSAAPPAPPAPPPPSNGNQPRIRPPPIPQHAALPFVNPPVQETSPPPETTPDVQSAPPAPLLPVQTGPQSPPSEGQEDSSADDAEKCHSGPEQNTGPAAQMTEQQDEAQTLRWSRRERTS
ncbi:vegetative cell wall protein gp1-like [Plectropomus leopardus]|uniref:vegetative cell wall protein gp1-like n=1 Tax=Plectropomus leopardus TaxID=160734 RepID=UPI001C4C2901|nr:vegetative cell wall protein gp1-like [Plectropomus leopardus]